MPILKISTIDHVTLVSSDFEKSRQFFVEVLGMREEKRPPFSFPGCWFSAGETMIHLNPKSAESGDPGWDSGAEDPPRGPHIAFRVSDASQASEAIKEHGIEIEYGPRKRPDGAVQFYIRDPDGHLIEICDLP